jgi:hypothetical protein
MAMTSSTMLKLDRPINLRKLDDSHSSNQNAKLQQANLTPHFTQISTKRQQQSLKISIHALDTKLPKVTISSKPNLATKATLSAQLVAPTTLHSSQALKANATNISQNISTPLQRNADSTTFTSQSGIQYYKKETWANESGFIVNAQNPTGYGENTWTETRASGILATIIGKPTAPRHGLSWQTINQRANFIAQPTLQIGVRLMSDKTRGVLYRDEQGRQISNTAKQWNDFLTPKGNGLVDYLLNTPLGNRVREVAKRVIPEDGSIVAQASVNASTGVRNVQHIDFREGQKNWFNQRIELQSWLVPIIGIGSWANTPKSDSSDGEFRSRRTFVNFGLFHRLPMGFGALPFLNPISGNFGFTIPKTGWTNIGAQTTVGGAASTIFNQFFQSGIAANATNPFKGATGTPLEQLGQGIATDIMNTGYADLVLGEAITKDTGSNWYIVRGKKVNRGTPDGEIVIGNEFSDLRIGSMTPTQVNRILQSQPLIKRSIFSVEELLNFKNIKVTSQYIDVERFLKDMKDPKNLQKLAQAPYTTFASYAKTKRLLDQIVRDPMIIIKLMDVDYSSSSLRTATSAPITIKLDRELFNGQSGLSAFNDSVNQELMRKGYISVAAAAQMTQMIADQNNQGRGKAFKSAVLERLLSLNKTRTTVIKLVNGQQVSAFKLGERIDSGVLSVENHDDLLAASLYINGASIASEQFLNGQKRYQALKIV